MSFLWGQTVAEPDSAQLAQRAVRSLAVSQAELAERLGVSIYTVRAWVTGRNGPLPETALLLADVLDEQSDELAGIATDLRAARRAP